MTTGDNNRFTPLQTLHPVVLNVLSNMVAQNMPRGVTFILLLTDGENSITASPQSKKTINEILEAYVEQQKKEDLKEEKESPTQIMQ